MNDDAPSRPRKLVFIANSMYSRILSGGDVHTLQMAEGALAGGYEIHFLCGHGMKRQLDERKLPVTASLTDSGLMHVDQWDSLKGQVLMLFDYLRRIQGTFSNLDEIGRDDLVYLNTDFWWDAIPGIYSAAERKVMILGMDCPTLKEVVLASRPDVKPIRLPSIHYWLSQQIGLRLFQNCRNKRLLYVHPDQKPRLLRMGYREHELVLISNGVDVARADAIPDQRKVYDAVWTGRVHAQKGIEDLLATLKHLAGAIPNFKALLIGKLKERLGSRIRDLGLADCVEFSGYVSENEKFRLLKCSRLFLMPSHYESWGIVIGEALASGVPVLGYRLDCYPAVFGELVTYVDPFDQARFQNEAARLIGDLRCGRNYLSGLPLDRFKERNSWQAARAKFCGALASLG